MNLKDIITQASDWTLSDPKINKIIVIGTDLSVKDGSVAFLYSSDGPTAAALFHSAFKQSREAALQIYTAIRIAAELTLSQSEIFSATAKAIETAADFKKHKGMK